ncbi:MAG: FAD-binding oxidoreductase [Actinobacteria bacterium]|nr:FAD-binding oxidoreductase [Actinomycetota bacterium]
MSSFDVGIVGAGVHGASAAYHLASRGVRVAIFEHTTPAGGPTGRSSAICRAYYTNPFLAAAARDSIAMLRSFPELTGRDAGFRQTGFFFLHPPEDAEQVRASVATLNAAGIEVELLSVGEVAGREPGFDLEGVGIAAYEVGAGYADPHATTEGLFARAVELGAEARLGRAVTSIEPDPTGGGSIVTVDGTRTACGRVLIAAGPWTRPLALQVGADLPLTVERHIVATFRWGAADPVPAHGDLIGGYYFRPEGEHLFLAGHVHPAPRADPDGYADDVESDEIEGLARLIVRRVPRLSESETQGGWASLYDVSPDWQPVIGEIAPGIFVDAGTSGHGFKLAPALGGHVADLVMGAATDPRLADFDPFRFERGARLDAGYRDARILG